MLMNLFTRTLLITGLGMTMFSLNANANTVINPSVSEDSLAEPGGILDTVFGLSNLTRIDDTQDEWWIADGPVNAAVIDKQASFFLKFGTIDSSDNFSSVLSVSSASGQAVAISLSANEEFRFGLDANNGAYIWASDESSNTDLSDHMVTWQYNDDNSNTISYVIAFEDLEFPAADSDFQDLVLLVSGASPFSSNDPGLNVPIPASVFLMLPALGLLMVRPIRK